MVGQRDPVEAGLVASLARPGGRITGMSYLQPELAGKRLQLLKEVLPRLTRVAVLANPNRLTSSSRLSPGIAPRPFCWCPVR